MKIIVCVKQVAALEDDIEFTSDERDVDRDYLDFALNEWDGVATEAALQLREQAGAGEVVVVTVGDDEAEEALRHCLAMGADRAIRVDCDVREGLAIAKLLAEAIRDETPDLVLCGVQSGDAVQGATGVALAEYLGLSRVAVVKDIEWSPGSATATVQRELEGGLVDVMDVDLPAVLTVQTGMNEPRYVTLRAVNQAGQVEVDVREPDDIPAPAHLVRRMFVPPKGDGAQLLEGNAAEVAARIHEIVKERLA